MRVGTSWASHPPHFCRLVYSKIVKNAQQEIQANKELALSWFRRYKSFDQTVPGKSYAMAVKSNPYTSKISSINVKNVGNRCTGKRVANKNSYLSGNEYPYLAEKRTCKAPTVARVPVKFGKCIPAKYSLQVPDSTVTLKNRFQCLQNLCDSQNNGIHDVIHTCTDDFVRAVHSVPNDEFKVKNYAKQGSVECKPSPSCSNAMSQPILATQTKPVFLENKNKTGLLLGDRINMEEQTNGRLSTSHTKINESDIFDTTFGRQLDGVVYSTSDVHRESQLTPLEIDTLVGNKNGNGLSDGVEVQVSSLSPNNHIHNFNITDGAYDRVTTDNLDLLLDQNYDLNILDTIEGGTTITKNQKNVINVMNNKLHTFGFCPLTSLEVYTGEPVTWDACHTDLEAHAIVTATGKPNYLAAHIPVASQLNINNWRSYLSNYWDVQLLDLLEYGFPLDVDRDTVLTSTETNHASALQNFHHVHSYIQEELSFQAMLGPFQDKPISLHVSPLMVRDKQDSMKKRTIMGTNSLIKLGPAALIYKVDISRAFRQIKIDPRDIDLLGLKFQNQYFIDKSVPFGYRNGSQIFQRCTDAIRFTMQQHGFPHLFNYIDDLIYTGLPSNINHSFQFLLQLLQELGLDISHKKLVSPSTSVVCLGIHMDTVNRTLSIPHEKLAEIVNICQSWVSKTYCGKRQLQSLLGSLLYISKCVKPARFFLNRMLALLRDNHSVNKILLNQPFFQDLSWFNTF